MTCYTDNAIQKRKVTDNAIQRCSGDVSPTYLWLWVVYLGLA